MLCKHLHICLTPKCWEFSHHLYDSYQYDRVLYGCECLLRCSVCVFILQGHGMYCYHCFQGIPLYPWIVLFQYYWYCSGILSLLDITLGHLRFWPTCRIMLTYFSRFAANSSVTVIHIELLPLKKQKRHIWIIISWPASWCACKIEWRTKHTNQMCHNLFLVKLKQGRDMWKRKVYSALSDLSVL